MEIGEEKYKLIEHTADIAFKAWGDQLANAFEHAALALTDVITDRKKIGKKRSKEIKVKGRDKEELLVSWLSELIYIFDVSNLLFSEFDLTIRGEKNNWLLKAKAYGEDFDPGKHPSGTIVKGISYHGLRVWETEEKTYVRVILDV